MKNKNNNNNKNIINNKEAKTLDINLNNNIEENEGIIINYKIEKENPKIRIFGHSFFNNNKDKLIFICNNKSYALNEFFVLSDLSEEKDILEIKLKGIKNTVNWSNMFKDCSLLISVKDNYNMDNIDVTDMSYMFSGCSSLLTLDTFILKLEKLQI